MLLHYNVISRICFHLYYFIMFPLPKYQIIMHFTTFCHAMNAFVHYLIKNWIEIVVKRHYTSTEAVKLFEEDDNEVPKLLLQIHIM